MTAAQATSCATIAAPSAKRAAKRSSGCRNQATTRNMIVMKSDIAGSRHSTLGGPHRAGLPAASRRITIGEAIPPIRTARSSAIARTLARLMPINTNAVWSATSEELVTTRGTAIVTPERALWPRALAALPARRPSCAGVEFGRRRLGVSTKRRFIEFQLPGFGAERVVRGKKGIVVRRARRTEWWLEGISGDVARRQ